MAFPGAGGLVQDNLDEAWGLARALARDVKVTAQGVRNDSASGILKTSQIFQLTTLLADAKDRLNVIKAMTGMGPYAQEQVGDSGINIATEFNSMISAMDSVVSWVSTNFPKDGSNFLLGWTMSPAGRLVDRVFSAAATAGFRTELDALTSSIS
jgi:hypothetical protein